MPTFIGHLDMDAFFAAIEERGNPQWAGKPIVVGSDPKYGSGRGVVSTANYAARKYGIHSAQPIRKAWELAEAATHRGEPEAIFTTGSYRQYGAVSKKIMAILQQFTPVIQQRSVDEAYFDLSHAADIAAATQLAKTIQAAIQDQERLSASIGIGPNKLIAKIASDFEKPHGLTVIAPEDAEAFLEPLSLRAIPGIGPKTQQLLKHHGFQLVRDLKQASREELHELLGKWGTDLYDKIRGQGSVNLSAGGPAKSLGEQVTFEYDTLSPAFLIPHLFQTADSLLNYLIRDGFTSFRTVVLTVRFANFETINCSKTMKQPISSATDLKQIALRLFLPFLDSRKNPQHRLIRLVGLRLEKLGV